MLFKKYSPFFYAFCMVLCFACSDKNTLEKQVEYYGERVQSLKSDCFGLQNQLAKYSTSLDLMEKNLREGDEIPPNYIEEIDALGERLLIIQNELEQEFPLEEELVGIPFEVINEFLSFGNDIQHRLNDLQAEMNNLELLYMEYGTSGMLEPKEKLERDKERVKKKINSEEAIKKLVQ